MNNYRYREARKRVQAKKEFFRHLGTYFVMSVFFFMLNAVTSFGTWWFIWPMLGWGLAVLFHYVDVFGVPGVEPISQEWEEREMRREMRRMQREDRQARRDEREKQDHRQVRPSPAGHTFDPAPEDQLELRPLPKRAKKWDESDLV